MLDKKAFMVVMVAFADIAGRSLKTGTLDVYYNALKDYTTEQFNIAASQLLKTRTYRDIPTPAEFTRIMDGDIITRANDAWAEALSCVRSGTTPRDPVSARLMQTLNLRDLYTENIPFARRDFIEAYKSMKGKSDLDNTLLIASEEFKKLTAGIGNGGKEAI